jgi:hypothetical protein
MSSGAKDTGRSMAMIVRTCRRSGEVKGLSVRTELEASFHDKWRLLTVLQNVANYAKLIKIAPTTVSAKRLFECNLDI